MGGMRAIFVQQDHVSPVGPLGERFAQQGFEVVEFPVVPAERFQEPNVTVEFPTISRGDVLIPMGAPWSCNDEQLIGSWLIPQMKWLASAHERKIPILGVCFGGQMMARILGGSVGKSPKPEIGWIEIQSDDPSLVPDGPWFAFHYERWQLPPGVTEIARNEVCSQAFVADNTLAVQFHPELDSVMLQGWLDEGGVREVSENGEDPDLLLAKTKERDPLSRTRAHLLVDAFLARVS